MAHISDSARKAFTTIFSKAVGANFSQGECRADVRSITSPTQPVKQRRDVLLLTTASLRFRLTSIFRIVDPQVAQRAYVQARAAQGLAVSENFSLKDHLLELGNMACGEMNRELLTHFANVALSSPSVLNITAERLFDDLRTEHVVHHAVWLDGELALDASLCMTANATVDFTHRAVETQVASGELELM